MTTKSLKTNRQKDNFLNSLYYSNKLVTIHTIRNLTDGQTDIHAYRRLDEQTDIWTSLNCIVIKFDNFFLPLYPKIEDGDY